MVATVEKLSDLWYDELLGTLMKYLWFLSLVETYGTGNRWLEMDMRDWSFGEYG